MKNSFKVCFVLIVLACNQCSAETIVGEQSPEIKIKSWVTDNAPDLRSLEGRVRVLDFWATWCGPCVSNIPHLVKLYGKYRPMGVEFVALSQDKSADKVRKLVREKGMNYLVAIDDGTVDRFKVNSYPTVVVIGHTGKVIWCGAPWDSKFERAISDAAKAFSAQAKNTVPWPRGYPKIDLVDAKTFIKPYSDTELAFFDARQYTTSSIASQNILAANDGVTDSICRADGLRKNNTFCAYDIYADFLTKYHCLEVLEPASVAYLQLGTNP
jgi:cytochrome c biogenesis protein CcmG, thiol:disulfide interchange protein DsbE